MTLQARTEQRKRQTIKQAPIGLHTISSRFGHFSPFQISTKHGSFKNAFRVSDLLKRHSNGLIDLLGEGIIF